LRVQFGVSEAAFTSASMSSIMASGGHIMGGPTRNMIQLLLFLVKYSKMYCIPQSTPL